MLLKSTSAVLVACVLLAGSFAAADKKSMKADPIVARVVDLEINEASTVVTVMAGSDKGVAKGWHATFLEGDSKKPLPDGEATIIRIDKRSTIIKTTLKPEQVRANRQVRFEP